MNLLLVVANTAAALLVAIGTCTSSAGRSHSSPPAAVSLYLPLGLWLSPHLADERPSVRDARHPEENPL